MPYPIKEIIQRIEATINQLEKQRFTIVSTLEVTVWKSLEPLAYARRFEGEEIKLTIGDRWGAVWDCGWFAFDGEIPPDVELEEVVALIDISGELCIYDHKGQAYQGLTNVNSEFERSLGTPGKRSLLLEPFIKKNQSFRVWADGACNDLFGNYQGEGRLKDAYLALHKREISDLYFDFDFLYRLYKALESNSPRAKEILFKLNKSAILIKKGDLSEAKNLLTQLLSQKSGETSLTVHAIGHAHMDLAWLWPIRETKRKGLRTFATVMRMMEQFKQYNFGASQPQLYQWVKEQDDHLYQQLVEKVKEGRWEVQGAMWVEADTNITGGESLIRQMLYGKKFFKEEFDINVDVMWLPDVFGYTSVLPQIMKKSDVHYFMTQKMSWNNYTKFPHHTFMWEGSDGTEILTHMVPEDTYNSPLTPQSVKFAETNYQEAGISKDCLLLYGIGDGGGGPGEEHLERAKRIGQCQGLSKVVQSNSHDFFHHLEENQADYVSYKGKLYLEKHQGTLTTSSKTKYYNKWFENTLKDLELFRTYLMMSHLPVSGTLEDLWKEVLLYQFHDILPGSSISRVYDESNQRYEIMQKQVNGYIDEAMGQLTHEAMIINTLGINRSEWVKWEDKLIYVTLKPYQWLALEDVKREAVILSMETLSSQVLENELIKVIFDNHGHIIELWDKRTGKMLLKPGSKAGMLAIYDDDGDAWDFSSQYRKCLLTYLEYDTFELKRTQSGMEAHLSFHYGKSEFWLKVTLQKHEALLRFDLKTNWQETHKMLRTMLETAIYSEYAHVGNQFGYDQISVKNNSVEDMARFEVCGHDFVDLSDREQGISLMAPFKYGYHIREGLLDLNLLRSATYPGDLLDKGTHHIQYYYYVHEGDFDYAQVHQMAQGLNRPLRVSKQQIEAIEDKRVATITEWLDVQSDHVIVDTVKPSENGKGVIVRLYETLGIAGEVTLHFKNKIQQIWLTNLIEEDLEPVQASLQELHLSIGRFEIVSLLIEFDREKEVVGSKCEN